MGGGVGTCTAGDAGGNGGDTSTAERDTGVWDDGVGSTRGDEAHTLGHVVPIRTQQPHVEVMRPAKVHRVSISTMATQCGRLCIASAVHSFEGV